MKLHQRILVMKGTQFHCQATWIERNGKWVCCGALKPMLYWVLEMTPEQAESKLRRIGVGFEWHELNKPD